MQGIKHACGLGSVHGIDTTKSQDRMFKAARIRRINTERLALFRRFLKEDPGAKYDLKTAFDVDPERDGELAAKRGFVQPDAFVKRTRSEIKEIRKEKHRKYQRIRERLMIEAMKESAQFVIGRHGVSDSIVNSIRKAFCYKEVVRLVVDSPWRDNMKEVAKRIEQKTGGTVVDRAGRLRAVWGGRVFLYRGFTHADLARKGLLTPQAFNDTDVDYEAMRQSIPIPDYPPPPSLQKNFVDVVGKNGVKEAISGATARRELAHAHLRNEMKQGIPVELKGRSDGEEDTGIEDDARRPESADVDAEENLDELEEDDLPIHPLQTDLFDVAEPRVQTDGKTDLELEMERYMKIYGSVPEEEDDRSKEDEEQLKRIRRLAEAVESYKRPSKTRRKRFFKGKPWS